MILVENRHPGTVLAEGQKSHDPRCDKIHNLAYDINHINNDMKK